MLRVRKTESFKDLGCGDGDKKKEGVSASGEESQEWLKEAMDWWREELVSHFLEWQRITHSWLQHHHPSISSLVTQAQHQSSVVRFGFGLHWYKNCLPFGFLD